MAERLAVAERLAGVASLRPPYLLLLTGYGRHGAPFVMALRSIDPFPMRRITTEEA